MDPNAEGGPPKAELAEVDVEVGLRERLAAPETPITPPLASSIFRSAREPGWDRPVHDADTEKVRQYQEDEFQRRLRGEYEAAQRRVGEIVYENMGAPLRLTSIRLAPPPPTTRTGFLSTLLAPFLGGSRLPDCVTGAPPPPQSLHEILLSTKALVQHIDQLNVFDMERVGIRLEPSPSGNPADVEMLLTLREKGRLFLKAGTEFGSNEGGGNVTARIRNAFGGAESLEFNASLGTKTKSAYQATLSTPLFASPYLTASVSGFSLDRDNTAFASHRELSQGGKVGLAAITPWGNHNLTYEYVTRDISHLTPTASASVRALAFQTTKASVSHTWTSDTRDDPHTGTTGRLLKATHEYAGLPGSSELAHFIKSTTQSQASRPLFPGSNIFVSVSSLTTILYPLWAATGPSAPGAPAGAERSTYLADRTYLGGPNSVRGFKVGGLGLSDRVDSLGGDLSYALGVSLIGPVPSKEHWPLKLHTFLNLGKVVRYDSHRSFADNIARMYSNPSLSVGVGLIYRFDPLRIELNFAMPLIARKGERLSRGLGVGVGIEFL
ncbi:SAM50-like protein SPAC17C906 [Vanrija pseudolonga]|uniref:SAM50-like protein SPAC17C906 n=1 Tax=Vanrija pseudolonga TaxID=143232 RepID=A0AAF1BJR0_9TREE|nr:SAM50-like protein SPAC17C906 [Vanrija pseudolonga]